MPDTMMAMILELSPKVNGQNEAVHEQEDTPSTSLSRPQVKRRRATHPDSLTQDLSILRQAPLIADFIYDENSSSEQGPITHRKEKDPKIRHGVYGCHSCQGENPLAA